MEQCLRSWYQGLGFTLINLTMLFVGGIWKTLGLWTRRVVGGFELGLMYHPSRSMEDSAEGNLICGNPVQEVSQQKNIIS